LSDLIPGRTYYFYVVSEDEAGNASTNNNGGGLFNFIAPRAPTALVIDEYQDPFFGIPPISGYTAALDQAGVSYDVWNVASLGAPTLATLQPYRAVLWRVPELTAAWNPAEQLAISNYL